MASIKRLMQSEYLKDLAVSEFGRQGFRGGIAQQAQIDTAARIARKIMDNNKFSPSEAVDLAVTYVRNAKMNVAPAARTVALCNCGKPKAPHSADLHS